MIFYGKESLEKYYDESNKLLKDFEKKYLPDAANNN